MAIIKRNKIKLPTSRTSNDDSSKHKITLNTFDDDEEEEDDEDDLLPIMKRNPIKIKSRPHDPTTEQDEGDEEDEEDEEDKVSYLDEINRMKQKPLIMNVEDLIESGRIPDDNPTSKKHSISLGNIRSLERDHVRLMNDDDRRTLIDTLTHNGKVPISSINRNEDDYQYDGEGEFEDDRLAIGSNEIKRQNERRRRDIEGLLEDVSLDEDDDGLLLLPRLSEIDDDDDEEEVDDIIHRNDVEIKKIDVEMKILRREYDQLCLEQRDLIMRLNNISL